MIGYSKISIKSYTRLDDKLLGQAVFSSLSITGVKIYSNSDFFSYDYSESRGGSEHKYIGMKGLIL